MGAPRPLYYALAPTARRGKTAPAILEARVFCPAPRPARASHWPRRRSRVASVAPGPRSRGLQPRSPPVPQANPDRAGAAAKKTAPAILEARFSAPRHASHAPRVSPGGRPDVSTSVAWPVRPPPALAPCRYVYLAPPVPRGRAEEHRASHTGGALSLPRTRLTPPPEALPRGGRRLRDRGTRAVALAAPRDAHSPAPAPPSAARKNRASHRRGALSPPRRPAPPPPPHAPSACPPRLRGPYPRLPPSLLARCAASIPQPPWARRWKIGPAIAGGALSRPRPRPARLPRSPEALPRGPRRP